MHSLNRSQNTRRSLSLYEPIITGTTLPAFRLQIKRVSISLLPFRFTAHICDTMTRRKQRFWERRGARGVKRLLVIGSLSTAGVADCQIIGEVHAGDGLVARQVSSSVTSSTQSLETYPFSETITLTAPITYTPTGP